MKRMVAAIVLSGLFCVWTAVSGPAADGAGGGELYARCARCHGDNGDKPPHVLKGQTPDAVLEKLNGYAAGTYGGDRKAVMQSMVKTLSDTDRQTLAAHIGNF